MENISHWFLLAGSSIFKFWGFEFLENCSYKRERTFQKNVDEFQVSSDVLIKTILFTFLTYSFVLILKKSWDEISDKTFQNCFCNAGISTQSQRSAMDENVDTFKEVLCNDDGLLVGLEFDLNQLCEVNPELAPANLSKWACGHWCWHCNQ